MDWCKILEVNLGKNKHKIFEVWFLNFPLKKETVTNIINQNVAELARRIIAF